MLDESLRQDLRSAYGKQTKNRDQREIAEWKIAGRSEYVQLLKLEGKARLLEIGAGTGQDSVFFSGQGLQVSCIDLSPENVASCLHKGLDAHVMDMCALEFPSGSFDSVFAQNCLLHVPKREFFVALKQVHQVLRQDGIFYLGQYGGKDSAGVWEEDAYDPPRFYSFFTDAGIQEAAEEVFHLERFTRIQTGGTQSELHFQSLILRKRVGE